MHPRFLDVVRIFSEKIGPVEESFNAFFVNIAPSVPLDKTRVPRDSALVGNDSTRADDCSFGMSVVNQVVLSVILIISL